MRNRALVAVLVVLLVCTPFAANNDHVPGLVIQARYVAITFLSASGPSADLLSPNLPIEDRNAMAAVESAFRDWKRYSVTPDLRHADIIVAVRVAQQSAWAGVNIGRDKRGPTLGADAGPNVDMMDVYGGYDIAAKKTDVIGPLLWRGTQRDGLKEPVLALVQQFRDQVEKAAVKNKK